MSYFFYTGFADHQAQGYRQFVWLIDFFQGKETIIGGYFCQSPRQALVCYKNDLINLIEYLLIPVIFLLVNFLTNFKLLFLKYKKFLIYSISFALLIHSFLVIYWLVSTYQIFLLWVRKFNHLLPNCQLCVN